MARTLEPNRLRFTRRDLELWPDDGKRRELIGGDIFVSPSPTWKHQQILFRLAALISRFLETHPVGQAVFAPMDLLLPGEDTVQPDFMFIRQERAGIISERGVLDAPDWVVEVLSPSNREYDLETKRRLYLRSGVPVYWAVDGDAGEVFEFTLERETRFSANDTASVPALPDLSIPIRDLLG